MSSNLVILKTCCTSGQTFFKHIFPPFAATSFLIFRKMRNPELLINGIFFAIENDIVVRLLQQRVEGVRNLLGGNGVQTTVKHGGDGIAFF